jgi:tripartite-type tricarboxylate transporter receptor subunit TctC
MTNHPLSTVRHTFFPQAPFAMALMALLVSTASSAVAADYPEKPVRIIVPTIAGAGLDTMTRLLAQKLTEKSGKAFVVDNRAGAGGAIGMEMTARAAPDGYTLAIFTLTHLAMSTVAGKQTVDFTRDFAPVCWISNSPYLLNVHPSVAAKNVAELIALARAKPNAINFGSTGSGGTQHLAGVMLGTLSGAKFFHVPYKGGAQVVNDLLGGQIQISFTVYPVIKPHLAAGRIRTLGVTTAKRAPALPEIPAIAETLPGYEINTWYGMVAPARTPDAVLEWLNRSINAIMQQQAIKQGLAVDATEVVAVSRADFARHLASEAVKWRDIVRNAGVTNQP